MRLTRLTGGILGGILIIALLLSIFFVINSHDFQKMRKDNQFYPVIYKNIVIWEDSRNGNLDIYGYNLLAGREFPITTSSANQLSPAIYKDIVVWQDNRNGNWDIYGYDLSTKEEFQITTNESDQLSPAIYKDTVIWVDSRNYDWDIYGYNLSKSQEFRITICNGNQRSPAIYGDIVVWQDYRNGNWDIYGYNFLKSQEFPISTDKGWQISPAIYKDIVIWMDSRNGNWDIYGYNLSGEKEFPVTMSPSEEPENVIIPIVTNSNSQRSPAIYGDIVVWYDNRDGNRNIYRYSLSKGESPITADSKTQKFPAIYEDTVVWMDSRNGNWNIYGYNLSEEEEFQMTTLDSATLPSSYPEDKSYYLFAYGGVSIAVAIIILSLYGTAKKYPQEELEEKKELEEKEGKVYRINAFKDSQSSSLIDRYFFFIVLFLFFSLNFVANYYSGSLTEIDIDSLPREKTILLVEEASSSPALKDPLFILTFLIPLIAFYPVRRFFCSIPNAFEEFFNNGIVMKKGSTREKVPVSDFNDSLKEFEKKINGSKIYLFGIFIYSLITIQFLLFYFSERILAVPLGTVSWHYDNFFFGNSMVYLTVVLSLFLTSALLISKMYWVVDFIRKLNNQFNLVLKPYDTDGLGGFGPLEQLWFNMISVIIPVLAVVGALSLLDLYVGIAHFSVERFFNMFLFSIVIVVLLVILVLYYYHIVKTQKTKMLNDIEKKIDTYYKKAHITEKNKDVDKDSMKQIELLQKVVIKVESIPSFPFTTLHKTYIVSSAAIPFIIQIINYFIQI